ncbi:hypothetical protein [Streptomyces sp. SID13726]|uniref:hypothetical protein n=1 Tax=Streptomyces sp. SID13726 TaxID=2706058 RepID=UPI0013B67FEB|nr:hypothetical protein [Streptomyces sp. SID13726]NEB01432.1 hypothetical protein [Streptomyces sp. SID13726]
MSGGFGADPEALKQAAKGITGAIEELQDVGAVGAGAVGRGFGGLRLTPLQMGHPGLADAFGTFAERWEWGVRTLVHEGDELAEKLDLSAGYYHEAEEYAIGVVKDSVMAGYGDPAASGEDAEQMSWSRIGSTVKDGWTPDLSQQSAAEATERIGQTWQSTQEDLTSSGQYGAQLQLGGEVVRESLGAGDDEPAGGDGT